MMSAAPKLIAALALVTLGCGRNDDEPIERTFDPCTLIVAPAPDLQLHELASIEEAMHMWHHAADTRVSIDDGSVDVAEAVRLEVRFDVAPPAFRGLYDDRRGIVFINRELKDAQARSIIVAHELGHSFGLLHVDPSERISLMNPENLNVAPTAEDARAVHARWGRCSDR